MERWKETLLTAAQAVCEGTPLGHSMLHLGGWYSCHAIEQAGGGVFNYAQRKGLLYLYTNTYDEHGRAVSSLSKNDWDRPKDGSDWWVGDTTAPANRQSRTFALLLFREALEDLT